MEQPADTSDPPDPAEPAGPPGPTGPAAPADDAVPAVAVTVVRSGGFAGLKRSWEATADDQSTVTAWLGFADSLPWGLVPSHDPRSADRYVYRIVIVVHAEVRHEATLPESELTGGWRELVDRVQKQSDDSAASTGSTGGSTDGSCFTRGAAVGS